jgi:hypothetical protein
MKKFNHNENFMRGREDVNKKSLPIKANKNEKSLPNKNNDQNNDNKKKEENMNEISPNWMAMKKQMAPTSRKSGEIKLKRKKEEKGESSQKADKKPKIDPKLYEITKHLALDCEMVGVGKDKKDSLASKKKIQKKIQKKKNPKKKKSKKKK